MPENADNVPDDATGTVDATGTDEPVPDVATAEADSGDTPPQAVSPDGQPAPTDPHDVPPPVVTYSSNRRV